MIELSAASPHILFTGLLAAVALRRHGLLPFPSGTILLLLASQIVFALVAAGTIEDRDLRIISRGGIEDHFQTTLLLYDALALLAFLSFAGGSRPADAVFGFGRRMDESTLPIHLAAALGLAVSLLHVASVDVAHLVSHRDYLSVAFDAAFLAVFGEDLAMTLFRALPFIAAVNAAMLVHLLASGRRAWAVVFLLLAAWQYLFLLSNSSRTAALVPIVVGACALALRPRARWTPFAASAALAVYALLHALIGRQMPMQGMAELPRVLAAVFSGEGFEAGLQLAVNIGQGIFVIAEGWRLEPAFGPEYSWLSLSPLPSFLDGFTSVLPEQVRLHDYVPMPAVTEIANFGPLHAAVGLALVHGLVRWHLRLADRRFAFLAINLLIFIGLYVALAYPVRSALRYIWLGYAIAFPSSLFDRWSAPASGRRLHAAEA